jgi:hypothetical protein
MKKLNLSEKLAQFSNQWKPKIVGELNGQQVKLVKFQGPFVWHHHDHGPSPPPGGTGYAAPARLTSAPPRRLTFAFFACSAR